MRRLLALALVLLSVTVASAQTITYPSMRDIIITSQVVSSSNAAAVKTIAAVANRATRVHWVSAFCSAGTATVTVAVGGVTKWSTSTGFINTNIQGWNYAPAPITAPQNTAVVITLSTCGSSNVGTLNVGADQY